MNKIARMLVCWLVFFGTLLFSNPAEKLIDLITRKDWSSLRDQCTDESHRDVLAFFDECRQMAFLPQGEKQLMFFARFDDHAEIGQLLYSYDGQRFRQLRVQKGLSSLSFIHSFSRFPLVDKTVKLGDAELVFKNGYMYQAQPLGTVFVFSGDWEFRIQPQNQEEQFTLKGLTGQVGLKLNNKVGLFVLDPEDILPEKLDVTTNVESLPLEVQVIYERFKEEWGQPIADLGETWYLPFDSGFCAVLFHPESDKKYFRYIHNPLMIPDTNLVLLPQNTFYLNYNARDGMKLTSSRGDDTESMRLKLYYNPKDGYIAGTADLDFKDEAKFKLFQLAEKLLVKAKVGGSEQLLFKQGDGYNIIGENLKNVRISYAGRFPDKGLGNKRAQIAATGLNRRIIDAFTVLRREDYFYPSPGLSFFKSWVQITVPETLNCLASGVLKSRNIEDGLRKSVFESSGLKDLALVCGQFSIMHTILSRIPITVYGGKGLDLSDYFSLDEVKTYFEFLLERYAPLPIGELNLLLSRGSEYGGVSHPGLILFNVVQTLFLDDDASVIRRIRTDSPVVFMNVNKDSLIHELSHQWWGGMISWKSYQDQWITEGLAQFSTLYYLQTTQAEKLFQKTLNDAKRWATRKSDAGPLIYGQRILNIGNDWDSFQSIIYNKGALVFMMLKEMLGEQAFLTRLNDLVKSNTFKSLSSAQFIRIFSKGQPQLEKFFKGWVYSRMIPVVKYQVSLNGAKAQLQFWQENTDFVFPISVRIRTASTSRVQTLIIDQKEQTFDLGQDAAIVSVAVETQSAPIRLEKKSE